MSYPRNAASPERVSIGAVVQISDGTVQTSGCTVSVTPMGGSETASGGTVAYSTAGIVLYTPTQAETNYTSFVLTAYKTGCIPATVTVVTSASSTAGQVDVKSIQGTTQTARDLGASVLLSSGTGTGQVDLTSGVVKANTTQIAGQTASAAGAVTFPNATLASTTNITAGTVTTATNVTSVGDKTGYALTAAYDAAKTAAQPGDLMAVDYPTSVTLDGSGRPTQAIMASDPTTKLVYTYTGANVVPDSVSKVAV